MATLRIEHAINDLQTWLTAFGRFADARERGGVRSFRIFQPASDDQYILVDLDFNSAAEAEKFKQFLEANVWSTPANSPGLAGAPQAQVLVSVAV
ncbi:MAG: hypothetical protein R2834_02140 [Rhodothermales bacterium]